MSFRLLAVRGQVTVGDRDGIKHCRFCGEQADSWEARCGWNQTKSNSFSVSLSQRTVTGPINDVINISKLLRLKRAVSSSCSRPFKLLGFYHTVQKFNISPMWMKIPVAGCSCRVHKNWVLFCFVGFLQNWTLGGCWTAPGFLALHCAATCTLVLSAGGRGGVGGGGGCRQFVSFVQDVYKVCVPCFVLSPHVVKKI